MRDHRQEGADANSARVTASTSVNHERVQHNHLDQDEWDRTQGRETQQQSSLLFAPSLSHSCVERGWIWEVRACCVVSRRLEREHGSVGTSFYHAEQLSPKVKERDIDTVDDLRCEQKRANPFVHNSNGRPPHGSANEYHSANVPVAYHRIGPKGAETW